jgi:hypothetical protein
MSYILKALKKSEAQRQTELSTAQIHAIHPSLPLSRKKHKKSRLWLYFFGFIVLSLAATYAVMSRLNSSVSLTVAPATLQQGDIPAGSPSGDGPESIIPELRATGKKIAVTLPSSDDTIIEPRPLPTVYQPQSLPAVEMDPAIPYLEELDQVLQETVPSFHLAGHVYSSDPQLRMILINRNIVREKERIDQDFILEEITPEGVILRSGDIRFRMKAY